MVDFDVLFIPEAPQMAALILPQLAYYDIRDVYLAGTNLWHSSQLIELAKDYAQNAVMVDGFFKREPCATGSTVRAGLPADLRQRARHYGSVCI